MAVIDTGIPNNQSGFIRFCIDANNPAVTQCRGLLVGPMTAEGTATNGALENVFSYAQAQELFGENSILADSVNTYFASNPNGSLWAIGMTDPVNGVNAEYELTVTGPATANGTNFFTIWGQDYAVNIASGDSAADIAILLANEINSDANGMYTAVANGDVVTLTFVHAGESGNHLTVCFNPFFGSSFVEGTTFELDQTVIGSGSYDADPIIDELGNCCYDCIGLLVYDEAFVQDWVSYLDDSTGTWACGQDQCFGHLFHYFPASDVDEAVDYGNITNDQERNIIPYVEGIKKFPPWRLPAAWAARQCREACSDPAVPVRLDNGYLTGLCDENDCGCRFTSQEKEALSRAGVSVWCADANGDVWIEENRTNWKTNEFGRPDDTWRRTERRYLVPFFIGEYLRFIENNYSARPLVNNGTPIPLGRRAVNPNILAAETRGWLRNFLGFVVDDDERLDGVVRYSRNTDDRPCGVGDPDQVDALLNINFVDQFLRLNVKLNVNLECN